MLFPECLAAGLERQLATAKALAAQDFAKRIPVALPGLLAKKYPYAANAERWAWLFPSHSLCRDPRANKLVRWRCHESNVQRAVRAAADRCHLRGIIPALISRAGAKATDGVCSRSLAARPTEPDPIDVAAPVGQEVSGIRVLVELGLGLPGALALPRSSHRETRSIPHA